MQTNEIKEYALKIGFDKIGIAHPDCIEKYVEIVQSRSETYSYFQRALTKPYTKSMPDVKSIIVLIKDYYEKDFPPGLTDMIGKLYLARSYAPPEGTVEHARLKLMKDYLIQNNISVKEGGLNIPARWVAAQAGIVTFGKNNFAYTEEHGSYIVIHTLLVDQEFVYDEPSFEDHCPPGCNACISACPTRALTSPYHLDPQKCIAFHNWITQEEKGSASSFIPHEVRPLIGSKIHGCDICQDVCPRNQKKQAFQKKNDPFISAISSDITLPSILHMDEAFFAKRIQPVMYNYISDLRYFKRNAAIAMGNSKETEYVPDLIAVLSDSDEVLREAASWALGMIKTPEALQALSAQLLTETSEKVLNTIHLFLSENA